MIPRNFPGMCMNIHCPMNLLMNFTFSVCQALCETERSMDMVVFFQELKQAPEYPPMWIVLDIIFEFSFVSTGNVLINPDHPCVASTQRARSYSPWFPGHLYT